MSKVITTRARRWRALAARRSAPTSEVCPSWLTPVHEGEGPQQQGAFGQAPDQCDNQTGKEVKGAGSKEALKMKGPSAKELSAKSALCPSWLTHIGTEVKGASSKDLSTKILTLSRLGNQAVQADEPPGSEDEGP
eukprot:gene17128-23432_t